MFEMLRPEGFCALILAKMKFLQSSANSGGRVGVLMEKAVCDGEMPV